MAKGGQGDDGEGFLGRWARRKQENREAVPEDDAPDGDGIEGEAGAAAADPDAPLSEEQVQALPDPESLTAGDDWSIFMKKGVPEELQRRALRRMWRLDPKFNFLDGMDDYALDYTDAATVVAGLKSLYQVGRGMVTEEETAAESAEAGEGPGDAADEASAGQEAAATSDDTGSGGPETETPAAADTPDDVESAVAGQPPAAEVASPPASSESASTRQNQEDAPRPAGTAVKRRWGRFST